MGIIAHPLFLAGITVIMVCVGIPIISLLSRLTTIENTLRMILKKQEFERRLAQGLPVDLGMSLEDYDTLKI